MTDYNHELDELLENYANAVYMSTEENGSIEDVYKAKAKLTDLLRRVEVEGRKDEIKWALSRTSMDELKARYKELEAEL